MAEKKKPYVYSKEAIRRKRTKSYQQDEVMQEVKEKLVNGVQADSENIHGDVLQKDLKKRASTYPLRKSCGKAKTRIQQLAETVPIPDELPDLPDYLRSFAFRYATEYRRHMDWANIFHVSIYTIRNWLLRAEVMQYVLKVKQERNALMAERLCDLEKKAYSKLDALLEMPINTDNAEVIRKTISDVLSLMKVGENGERDGVTVNVNQQQSQQQQQVVEDISIVELKEQIDEIEMLDEEIEEG